MAPILDGLKNVDLDYDECPDVPFSESAPEQYADYFDEDGNFVPKETSGGGDGDCPFTTATLTFADIPSESIFFPSVGQLPDETSVIVPAPLAPITQNSSFPIVLYNGSSCIFTSEDTTDWEISGSITRLSGGVFVVTGDAIITPILSGGGE